jgi:chromate transporter
MEPRSASELGSGDATRACADPDAPRERDVPSAAPASVPFADALKFWIKLGFISFGGPAGQIAILHRELVERRRWISETRFLHALNFCMVLPGPEAQQLATYMGWLLHRTRGGLAAGILFVLPSVGILYGLSWAYAVWGQQSLAVGVLDGFKAVVVALVVEAVLRIGRRALRSVAHGLVAASAFAAIYFAHVPFPYIVLLAALVGAAGARLWPAIWTGPPKHAASRSTPSAARAANSGAVDALAAVPLVSDSRAADSRAADARMAEGVATQVHAAEAREPVLRDDAPAHTQPSFARVLRILALALVLWSMPFVAVGAWLGWDSLPLQQYGFYTGAAFVTFGGAYAVLAYVTQAAVSTFGWITSAQAVDGLALAETTPGPLIMVLQFVGFMTGWNHPGELSPLAAATLAALLTTWATFLPCFVFVFVGAPYIESLRKHSGLNGAFSGVTAAVLGVVLNLALVFGAAVLFPRGMAGGIDLFTLALAVAAMLALTLRKTEAVWVVIVGGLAGLARSLL